MKRDIEPVKEDMRELNKKRGASAQKPRGPGLHLRRIFSRRGLRKAGGVAVFAFVIFFSIVYVNTGYLVVLPAEAFPGVMAEMGLFSILLLAVYYLHAQVSSLMQKPVVQAAPAQFRALFEGVLVGAGTLVLNYLIIFVPLLYLIDSRQPPEGRVRTVLAVSAAISLFFYYYTERERSRRELERAQLREEQLRREALQAELSALKSQLSPHFLFNSLSVLSSLIPVEPGRAVRFTQQLARLYRSFLEQRDRPLVPLNEEMELLKDYLELLKTRFGESLQIEAEVPPQQEALGIPPGTLQLLVENAVKHNAFSKRSPLRIVIGAEGSRLVVRNNCRARFRQAPSSGYGLSSIQERYQSLCGKGIEIERGPNSFAVRLPLLKENEHEHIDSRG